MKISPLVVIYNFKSPKNEGIDVCQMYIVFCQYNKTNEKCYVRTYNKLDMNN